MPARKGKEYAGQGTTVYLRPALTAEAECGRITGLSFPPADQKGGKYAVVELRPC